MRETREIAMEEMRDTEELIDRILYLDGVPNMQKYMRVNVGTTVPEMHQFDLDLEKDAVGRLNAGVELCRLGAGESFGDLALLDGGPRPASVQALTPCRLFALDRAAFLARQI